MKKKVWLLLLGMIAMSGCTHTARLYPIQGPLSTQTPLPVLFAKITGAFTPGDMSVVLSDGEVCKGHWVIVHRVSSPKGAAPANLPTTAGMPAVWDTVYGPGFYVSRVLGARLYAQAVATGNRGTVFNVEMYKSEGGHDDTTTSTIKGVARDNKDNIYKLVL